jgi:hypothetical protein
MLSTSLGVASSNGQANGGTDVEQDIGASGSSCTACKSQDTVRKVGTREEGAREWTADTEGAISCTRLRTDEQGHRLGRSKSCYSARSVNKAVMCYPPLRGKMTKMIIGWN